MINLNFFLNIYEFVSGTVIPFLIVLTTIVFIHEMAHYLVGRWCGIAVEKFSIGFGPEIFGFNDRNATRWSLSLIPLGGYVKFEGEMTNFSSSETLNSENKTSKTSFSDQVPWKKILTVLAGPISNFLLSIALLTVLFYSQGHMIVEPIAEKIQAGSPAEKAGFQPGDRFVRIDGIPVNSFSDIQNLIPERSDREIIFEVRRGESLLKLFARPKVTEHIDSFGNKIKIPTIGIINDGAFQKDKLVSYSVFESFEQSVVQTSKMITETFFFLKRLFEGQEDHCKLGGPIKIASVAGKAAQNGFVSLLHLIVLLSTGIGVLNLIPVPPLDGGHIAFYTIEWVMGRSVSEKITKRIYQTGFFLIIMLMAFVFWNDLFGC